MAFFFFGISFFVMEIFTFLYYANEESDDIIGGSTYDMGCVLIRVVVVYIVCCPQIAMCKPTYNKHSR